MGPTQENTEAERPESLSVRMLNLQRPKEAPDPAIRTGFLEGNSQRPVESRRKWERHSRHKGTAYAKTER